MKRTFYTVLRNTFEKKNLWDYYNEDHDFGQHLPVESESLSREFLKNFIKVSGKSEQELFRQIEKIDSKRIVHTVSAFFIGHYIYNNTILKERIDAEIDGLISKYELEDCNIEFSYLWYLICVFHDLGYKIESEDDLGYETIDELIGDTKELYGVVGVPLLYSNIYKNYFQYRRERHNKKDHGIVAAFLLFKSLCEIRDLSERGASSDLCWDKNLEYVYNFCAWNILVHNIWYVDDTDVYKAKEYEENGLKELIKKDDEYKISLGEHPFLFLFCLVDTIEPSKRLYNIYNLKKVSIEIINKSTVRITSKLKCGCHDEIIGQGEFLSKWLIKANKIDGGFEINLGL